MADLVDQAMLKEVSLRYVTDRKPGFTRKRQGDKEFDYFDLDGKKITEEAATQRINKLAIPPAWQRVWICPSENGHLQATGYDDKGRKQYRYHKRWIEISQQQKFIHLLDFAKTLPKIRRTIRKHMALPGMPREKVLATIVWLLENTLIRVGNEEYRKENHSYGLTTLRRQHADISGNTIKFAFKGKSGVYHDVKIINKKIAAIVRRCQELPGQELFAYIDEEGKPVEVSSDDINAYLQEITGKEITAKDFRTWGGTTLAAKMLDKSGLTKEKTEIKETLVATVKSVAQHLRNRPATSRKYYIHPIVFQAYEAGYTVSTISRHKNYKAEKMFDELDACENNVVCMLKVFLAQYQETPQ